MGGRDADSRNAFSELHQYLNHSLNVIGGKVVQSRSAPHPINEPWTMKEKEDSYG